MGLSSKIKRFNPSQKSPGLSLSPWDVCNITFSAQEGALDFSPEGSTRKYQLNKKGIIVLMYHRVNDSLKPNELVVPINNFKNQMRYLKQHCCVMSMDDFKNALAKPHNYLKQRVLITFDDGYRDNYLNAYPILKKLKLSAAMFLITSMIGTNKKRLRYKHMPCLDMLNWREVREMSRNRIFFGGHTFSHPHLTQLSYKEQSKEIKRSFRDLRKNLQIDSIKAFCYPYGEYSKGTLNILKELNIKYGFTVKPKINTSQTSPLELGRIGISGLDTMRDFKRKVFGLRCDSALSTK